MQDIDSLICKLENSKKSLDNAVLMIKKLKRTNDNLQIKNYYKPQYYGCDIIKKMLLFLHQGFDELTALSAVAKQYEGILKKDAIEHLWQRSRSDRNALELYGKSYAAKKMRVAGFKINEIAITLGISSTSVYKLLHAPNQAKSNYEFEQPEIIRLRES